MSDNMNARRTEFRDRISELIAEYDDVVGPAGQYQCDIEVGHTDFLDAWSTLHVEVLNEMFHVAGWVLVMEHDLMNPGVNQPGFVSLNYPDAQALCMTQGLLGYTL